MGRCWLGQRLDLPRGFVGAALGGSSGSGSSSSNSSSLDSVISSSSSSSCSSSRSSSGLRLRVRVRVRVKVEGLVMIARSWYLSNAHACAKITLRLTIGVCFLTNPLACRQLCATVACLHVGVHVHGATWAWCDLGLRHVCTWVSIGMMC